MLTTLGFQPLAFVLVVGRRAVRASFPFSLDVSLCFQPWQEQEAMSAEDAKDF